MTTKTNYIRRMKEYYKDMQKYMKKVDRNIHFLDAHEDFDSLFFSDLASDIFKAKVALKKAADSVNL